MTLGVWVVIAVMTHHLKSMYTTVKAIGLMKSHMLHALKTKMNYAITFVSRTLSGLTLKFTMKRSGFDL